VEGEGDERGRYDGRTSCACVAIDWWNPLKLFLKGKKTE
jgi:hypothetical protein